MNLYQRIVLILGAVGLYISVYMRESLFKRSFGEELITVIIVLCSTGLVFFALKDNNGKKKD